MVTTTEQFNSSFGELVNLVKHQVLIGDFVSDEQELQLRPREVFSGGKRALKHREREHQRHYDGKPFERVCHCLAPFNFVYTLCPIFRHRAQTFDRAERQAIDEIFLYERIHEHYRTDYYERHSHFRALYGRYMYGDARLLGGDLQALRAAYELV